MAHSFSILFSFNLLDCASQLHPHSWTLWFEVWKLGRPAISSWILCKSFQCGGLVEIANSSESSPCFAPSYPFYISSCFWFSGDASSYAGFSEIAYSSSLAPQISQWLGLSQSYSLFLSSITMTAAWDYWCSTTFVWSDWAAVVFAWASFLSCFLRSSISYNSLVGNLSKSLSARLFFLSICFFIDLS